jgi:hypothetical protein
MFKRENHIIRTQNKGQQKEKTRGQEEMQVLISTFSISWSKKSQSLYLINKYRL